MSSCLICSDVGTSAALLMVWFGVIARLTGVPDRNIVTARVTIIPVIVIFLGIGRTVAVSVGSGQWCCGNVSAVASGNALTSNKGCSDKLMATLTKVKRARVFSCQNLLVIL